MSSSSGSGPKGRIEVCPAETFDPGERRIVETDAFEIGVFNLDGEYHALLNNCLHQNGPVCEGGVVPKIVGEFSEPGERVEERFADEQVIKCPWHGWEYEIETGRLLDDEGTALPTFEVAVEDGTVYVEL